MTITKDGFSLIELLIVLFIIAVLISIAVPTYNHHLMMGKRLDGKISLLDLATRLERYYTEQHTYANATIGAHSSSDVLATPFSQQGFYRLSIINQTNTSFLIQAAPMPEKLNDKNCGALQLNQLGEKSITGSGTLVSCWGK